MRVDVTRAAVRDAGRPIDVPVAVVTWVGAFVVGQLISLFVLGLSGAEDVDDVAIPTLFVALAATWAAYLAGLWWASRRSGTGNVIEDYRVRFRPVDLVGVPIGVLTQLVLVPLVYLPLSRLWPSTFSEEELSDNAERLVDRAGGATMVLLVVMVCICAPIVEELVYRASCNRRSPPASTTPWRWWPPPRGSPSSTSARSSTPGCSRSGSSPGPACSSPADWGCPS